MRRALSDRVYDIVIVGGGINGCGIARDAAGRGLKVLLAEMDDLASGTSSASTKLIHGGLRYLEYYEFRLVREALSEREVLLEAAPHIIEPLRFILPHSSALRPAWMIRLGLFLYDHLGKRKHLPGCRMIDLRRDEAGKPLKKSFTKAFEYSDCWTDDARLVVLNAIGAAEQGAEIRVRTAMTGARRENGLWHVTLENRATGAAETVTARALVNAAGPWVEQVAASCNGGAKTGHGIRLVKGSHIVVPKMFDHQRAYILQNPDRRIIFAIPYQQDFTLIGTTDVDVKGGPGKVEASAEEIDYLCAAISDYFEKPVSPKDVVWSFAGIRPLFDDGGDSAQATTRDYVLELSDVDGALPKLSIFGGKITSYRELSEEVMGKLGRYFPGMKPDWTAKAPLPGGDFDAEGFEDLLARLRRECPVLPEDLARRLCRTYGTRAWTIVRGVETLADMGQDFGAGLYERELEYLMKHEWARTLEDVIWRRGKLGLHLDEGQQAALEQWLQQQSGRPGAGGA